MLTMSALNGLRSELGAGVLAVLVSTIGESGFLLFANSATAKCCGDFNGLKDFLLQEGFLTTLLATS